MMGLLLVPFLGATAAAVDVLNSQFDTWTSTSQTFTFSGSWSPTSAGIPDNWTSTPGGYYGVNQSVTRENYTTGTGSDAGVHGSYVARVPTGNSTPFKIAQTIAIPASASGQTITVRAWVRYWQSASGSSGTAQAVIALGSDTATESNGMNVSSGSGKDIWREVALVVPNTHTLAGTNATLELRSPNNYSGGTWGVEWASVSIAIP